MRVSLLIPTHNRPEFLARALRYYWSVDTTGISFWVLDSSDEPIVARNRRTLLSYLPRAHHVICAGKSFFEKLKYATSALDTDYVAISGDDDFHDLRACIEAATFLDRNSDHAVAHGHAFSVVANGDNEVLGYEQAEIQSPTAAERLRWHLAHYCPTFYSVHRRKQLLRTMRLAAQFTRENHFGELLPSCAALCMGRSKSLDIPFLLRQGGHARSESLTNTTVDEYVGSPQFLADYADFSDALARELARADLITRRTARQIVDTAFGEYVRVWVREATYRRFTAIVAQLAKTTPRVPGWRDILFARATAALRRKGHGRALPNQVHGAYQIGADLRPMLGPRLQVALALVYAYPRGTGCATQDVAAESAAETHP